jgi:hypothetical protein
MTLETAQMQATHLFGLALVQRRSRKTVDLAPGSEVRRHVATASPICPCHQVEAPHLVV